MAIWHKSVQKKLRSFHFTLTNYLLAIQTSNTVRTHYLYRKPRIMIFYDKRSGRIIWISNCMKDWTSNWIRLCVWMRSLEKESKEFSIMRMYGHSNLNHFLLHTNASRIVSKYQSFLIVCIVNWLVEPKWTSSPDICRSKKSQLFHSNNNVSWVRAHLLLFLIAISFVRSICQINHGKQTVSPSHNNNPRVA